MLKKVWALLLIIILASSVLGCGGGAAKPMDPNGNNNRITPKGAPAPVTPQPNTERVMADRLANVARQVSGVKAATVVVSKNADGNDYTAMIGIELNSDIKGNSSESVKKQVADKVKSSEKQVSKVLVTTDPNLITRLKDIAEGVIKGKPISSFGTEIEELARRIAPTMR